jgi:NADH:ubiquinone oxidoreductase subunit D
MQVVGMVARASGIDADARRDAPFAPYERSSVRVPVYETGDVWARTMVRLDEARESARLITACLDGAAAGAAQDRSASCRRARTRPWWSKVAGPDLDWVLADGPPRWRG